MQLTIPLPERESTLAFHRQLWDEIACDPRWAGCAERIETNAFGQIIVTPPADFAHGRRQFLIANAMEQRMGGRSLTECPIATADGVKAADAAWYSIARYDQVKGDRVAGIAPEICVEVMSPRNSAVEMRIKRELYFSAGALECWTCDLTGKMSFFHHDSPDTPQTQSKLCPNFPNAISD